MVDFGVRILDMRSSTGRIRAFIPFAIASALAISLIGCGQAFALNGSEVGDEFGAAELVRLFVKVEGLDDRDFVMCDYSADPAEISYLGVRDEYRERYEELVSDGVPVLSAGTLDSLDTVFPGRPLVEVASTASSPWCDLLLLRGYSDGAAFQSSGFLVGDGVALTAAHCVTRGEDFLDSIVSFSNYDNFGLSSNSADVGKAVVPSGWFRGAHDNGHGDYEYDFAILILDDGLTGVSGSAFGYDSITVADSLGLGINCAGWLVDHDGTAGYHAWKNANAGGISLIDDLGNTFHADLSWDQGMSGGPVYYQSGDSFVAVGIVSHHGSSQPSWNYAMRITESCECVIAWANEEGYSHIEASGSPGGTISPFTGPGDDFSLSELQVAAQQRIQATRPDDIPEALERAMELNPDVFGWLYVPGTSVSLPVAKREGDSSYYLRHDSLGNESSIGCACTQQGAGDLTDAVTVLYGHSFSAGSLAFTSLHEFEDYAFFAGHEKAYLYLPGRRLEYRVVGANLFNARAIEEVDQSDAADLGDYFAELCNPDPGAFMGFKRRFPLDAGRDRVLQLSTCTVPADPAHRFVVTSVLEGRLEV